LKPSLKIFHFDLVIPLLLPTRAAASELLQAALRRSADAVLSREHADQFCGERRRGRFPTCGAFRGSESAVRM